MNGRIYTVTFQALTTAAQLDLFYVKPAADKPIEIEALYLSNVSGTTDAGDAQEEDLDLRIIRLPATVTASSGGSSATPRPIASTNDAAAGFTARIGDTSIATTSGTAQQVHSDGWNARVPMVWMPPPEHRIGVANAEALVVRLQTAPADTFSVNGTLYVRETI